MESNPYLEARREWDERYADLVLGKPFWQIAAGGLLLLSLVLASGTSDGIFRRDRLFQSSFAFCNLSGRTHMPRDAPPLGQRQICEEPLESAREPVFKWVCHERCLLTLL